MDRRINAGIVGTACRELASSIRYTCGSWWMAGSKPRMGATCITASASSLQQAEAEGVELWGGAGGLRGWKRAREEMSDSQARAGQTVLCLEEPHTGSASGGEPAAPKHACVITPPAPPHLSCGTAFFSFAAELPFS